MGISYTANAQSCKIAGLDDGSTCMVTNDWQEGNVVYVDVENDSESTCANVTVEVVVTYKGGKKTTLTLTFTGRAKSCPGSTCKVTVPIQEKNSDNWDMTSYKVNKISGTKCTSF